MTEASEIVKKCRRYAKIIEGIIVSDNDGNNEQREPKTTLLAESGHHFSDKS